MEILKETAMKADLSLYQRLRERELLTSRHNGLYQERDNMVQEVNVVLADPDTVHTVLSLRVDRETSGKL